MAKRKTGLKRGLDALLANKTLVSKKTTKGSATDESEVNLQQESDLRNIPVEFLRPGKYQPRRDIGDEGLEEFREILTETTFEASY